MKLKIPPRRWSLQGDIARWGNRLSIVLNLSMMGAGAYFIATRGLETPSGSWTYADLVSILLTAVGVLLAIVALFVAVLAIWGYTAIREAAADAATKVASVVAERVARDTASTVASRVGASTSETVDTSEADLETELMGKKDG